MNEKRAYLKTPVEHLDFKATNVVPLVEQMGKTAFSARDLANAARIYDRMLQDPGCNIFLCLAGSIVSAGMKQVLVDMVTHNMVDVIVASGANIVDQDFFEGCGFRHYQGTPLVDDDVLRRLKISRIYDTYIDEDELCEVDKIITRLAEDLEPRPYSSREFIQELGRYLQRNGKDSPTITRAALEHDVPIFVPAFSDCAAGFGLLNHQWKNPDRHVSIDSVKDFLELALIKRHSKDTGLFEIGGGVPKNFAQDVALATDVMGKPPVMHKYAIQITVADVRDGALSGSTLREACSWGKVSLQHEQMVYAEVTLALPLIAGYAYHKGSWKNREKRRLAKLLERELVQHH